MTPSTILAAGPTRSKNDACSNGTGSEQPFRTLDQRHQALAYANEIRSYRAGVKRDIAAGRLSWQHVLTSTDPLLQTMKVLEVLMAVRRVGSVRADVALRAAKVSPSKTIGGLTIRQKAALGVMRITANSEKVGTSGDSMSIGLESSAFAGTI